MHAVTDSTALDGQEMQWQGKSAPSQAAASEVGTRTTASAAPVARRDTVEAAAELVMYVWQPSSTNQCVWKFMNE